LLFALLDVELTQLVAVMRSMKKPSVMFVSTTTILGVFLLCVKKPANPRQYWLSGLF